ncbi:MAG: septum formation initiator family protein [bacterium]
MIVIKKNIMRLFLIIITIVGLTISLYNNINDNINRIIANKKSLVELEVYYGDLISKEESLKSEVTKLSDPDYVARYAKEKYLYSTDGEIIIRFE